MTFYSRRGDDTYKNPIFPTFIPGSRDCLSAIPKSRDYETSSGSNSLFIRDIKTDKKRRKLGQIFLQAFSPVWGRFDLL